PPDHWALRDLVAVVATEEKAVGSAKGHLLAGTSPFLSTRLAQVARQLPFVRRAILERDLAALGPVIETDALAMHFVMMSSTPPLFYWAPATITLIKATQHWRTAGLPVYFTIDAGPNVHLICEAPAAPAVERELRALPEVLDVIVAAPGPGVILQQTA
ncbi:MAG TPA: diphosphomevalonate decarboxylase, partial [Chloroflexi bacterium]|nr:diphosphomevalonate decarboxylase [Chloroflexota bacterium]